MIYNSVLCRTTLFRRNFAELATSLKDGNKVGNVAVLPTHLPARNADIPLFNFEPTFTVTWRLFIPPTVGVSELRFRCQMPSCDLGSVDDIANPKNRVVTIRRVSKDVLLILLVYSVKKYLIDSI